MKWTRSETIALASMKCNSCEGLGLCQNARGEDLPCNCVLRAIFRACYKRFKSSVEKGGRKISTVKIERTGAGSNSHMYFSRKTEEYIADFNLICKRTLTEGEYRLFKFHYLLGADAKLVASREKMGYDNLLHHYARIEIKVGRAFRETAPFALYPLDEYFSDTVRGAHVAPTVPKRAA